MSAELAHSILDLHCAQSVLPYRQHIENPQIVQNKGEADHSLEILENLEILDSIDSSGEKTPFVMTPFPCPDCVALKTSPSPPFSASLCAPFGLLASEPWASGTGVHPTFPGKRARTYYGQQNRYSPQVALSSTPKCGSGPK